jgi:hypothetical protein
MKAEPVMQSTRVNSLSCSTERKDPIMCTLYEAKRDRAPIHEDAIGNARRSLMAINPKIPFVHLMESQGSNTINTCLGGFPEGSMCSYQLAKMEPGFEVVSSFGTTDTLRIYKDQQMTSMTSDFPALPLRESVAVPVSTNMLNSSQSAKLLHFEQQAADLNVIEKSTRQQRQCPDWAKLREYRLNSSSHKKILCRRVVTKKFCLDLNKYIHPNRAMQCGIDNEEKGKYYYGRITGNIVLQSGYVIYVTAPWLGTSPDGNVFDRRLSKPYGLLEVKCPYKWRDIKPSEACKDPLFYCGSDENERPFLKENTDYYQQVQSQMGITGAEWCDIAFLFNKGIIILRVAFNEQKWFDCKNKLTDFYFKHFINNILP